MKIIITPYVIRLSVALRFLAIRSHFHFIPYIHSDFSVVCAIEVWSGERPIFNFLSTKLWPFETNEGVTATAPNLENFGKENFKNGHALLVTDPVEKGIWLNSYCLYLSQCSNQSWSNVYLRKGYIWVENRLEFLSLSATHAPKCIRTMSTGLIIRMWAARLNNFKFSFSKFCNFWCVQSSK